MTIKKFEGATREEAIALAQQELGDEVVIMNVKEVPQSGILGMFKRSNIQVTAAIEDDSDETTFLESTPPVTAVPVQRESDSTDDDIERENLIKERESLLRGLNAARPAEGRRFNAAADEDIPISETSSQGVFKDTSEEDLKSAFTEITEVLKGASSPLPQASTYDRNASLVKYNDPIESTDYSRGETRRMPGGVRESFHSQEPKRPESALEALSRTKVMPDVAARRSERPNVTAPLENSAVSRGSTGRVPTIRRQTSTLPDVTDSITAAPKKQNLDNTMRRPDLSATSGGVLRMLYNTLLDNDVDEHYVNEVLNDIEGIGTFDDNLDPLISGVYQKMVLKVGRPRTITLYDNKPVVAFFIGPTGVGKTTTIAKLASQYKLDHKKDVALLSADTYRIAAEQQLSVYAERLDLPLDIMYPGEDINEKIAQFKKYDLIFVDTAGFSHNNETQREDMKRMLGNVSKNQLKEIYLVLSATTKYRDLKEIVDTYKDITGFNLVFTKLDETTTFGNLLNIRMYADAPLSYVTNGQNVPNDIEVVDGQKLVRRLLEVH